MTAFGTRVVARDIDDASGLSNYLCHALMLPASTGWPMDGPYLRFVRALARFATVSTNSAACWMSSPAAATFSPMPRA